MMTNEEVEDKKAVVGTFKYNDNGFNSNNSIAIVWHIDDVKATVKDSAGWYKGLELTDDECMEVLWHVNKNHDAEHGVGWETIRCAIEICFEDRIIYQREA